MDSLLIQLFDKTCALSFTEGWVCVSKISSSGSPFNSYILFSFGYLISAALVLPLSLMSLVENIKFQLASVATLFVVMAIWIYIFASHGLNRGVPLIGSDQSGLVGFVISNFAFITTVPSFINELSRHVSIHKTIAYPILVCVVLYIVIGLTGAASFQINSSSDILATLSSSHQSKALITIVNILFPIAVLVTSIPVFAIVIRYNLVRGDFCSNGYAIVWASFLPWVLIIPFQTKGWLVLVMNWTSLVFGSSTNFVIPLLLYLASKRFSASTADTAGGDLFVLHRETSLASIHSPHRNFDSPDRSPGPRALGLHPVMTIPDEDLTRSIYEPSSSQNIVVISPPRSRRGSFAKIEQYTKESDGQTEFADNGQEDTGSTPEPSPMPLRVVYSPAVMRNPSFRRSSQIQTPSLVTNIETDLGSYVEIPYAASSALLSSEARLPSQSNVYRSSRHNSTTSNIEARLPAVDLRTRSSESTRSPATTLAANAVQEAGYEEDDRAIPLFKAFVERRWFRSIIFAKFALGIVACSVLGNLIYTIIETARGNNPLGA